jgi:hypothetical protein
MDIQFIQYLRPHGVQVSIYIDRPDFIATLAGDLVKAGYQLESECLMDENNSVHFEVIDPITEESLADVIVANGPEVPTAIDKMIEQAHHELTKDKDN